MLAVWLLRWCTFPGSHPEYGESANPQIDNGCNASKASRSSHLNSVLARIGILYFKIDDNRFVGFKCVF